MPICRGQSLANLHDKVFSIWVCFDRMRADMRSGGVAEAVTTGTPRLARPWERAERRKPEKNGKVFYCEKEIPVK